MIQDVIFVLSNMNPIGSINMDIAGLKRAEAFVSMDSSHQQSTYEEGVTKIKMNALVSFTVSLNKGVWFL